MLTMREFTQHVNAALRHLYDPSWLRSSPLAVLLAVSNRGDAPLALQRILTETIESMHPSRPPAPHSRAGRFHDLLVYRFMQQFAQREVANQLGLSERHMRREQKAAIDMLTCKLWDRFSLGSGMATPPHRHASPSPADQDPTTVNKQLDWLARSRLDEPTNLAEEIAKVQALIEPMVAKYEGQVVTQLADGLPDLAAHPLALRQALISVLTIAIHRCQDARLSMACNPSDEEVEIRISCPCKRQASMGREDEDAQNLRMAQKLADLCGGRLIVSDEATSFAAVLTIPAFERLTVLVIDDHVDTLQLLERCTSGTRYRLICVREATGVMDMVRELHPQVIVLDVMMPEIDGWALLGELRQHPETRDIPVILCTVLPQEELALFSGAAAFLQKPVTRQAVIDALDEQFEHLEQAPR